MTALAAAARFFAGRGPWTALVLLGTAGWILKISHAALHGPFAFMLLISAAIWLAWWDRKNPVTADPGDRRGDARSAQPDGLTR
jgi:hypothetical protein